jgi:argininosuccinate synthase
LRDIEALITSSQSRVTGETRVRLASGRFHVVGTRSPYSMMDRSVATYGEENRLWTGDEARAFARVAAVPSLLAARAANGLSKKLHHEGTKDTKGTKGQTRSRRPVTLVETKKMKNKSSKTHSNRKEE